MQAPIATQIESFTRYSTELAEGASGVTKAFWSACSTTPWKIGPWAQLGKSCLSAAQSLTDTQNELYTQSLQDPLRTQQLSTLAESTREVNQIMRDFSLALTQRQLETCGNLTNFYSDWLVASKQAASPIEVLATQMQWPTNIHNTVKDHAMGTFELFSSLQTALTAWSENTLNAMANATAASVPQKEPSAQADTPSRASSAA